MMCRVSKQSDTILMQDCINTQNMLDGKLLKILHWKDRCEDAEGRAKIPLQADQQAQTENLELRQQHELMLNKPDSLGDTLSVISKSVDLADDSQQLKSLNEELLSRQKRRGKQ